MERETSASLRLSLSRARLSLTAGCEGFDSFVIGIRENPPGCSDFMRDGSQGKLFRLCTCELLQRSPLLLQVFAYLSEMIKELTDDSISIEGIQVIVRRCRREFIEGVCLDADRIT